MTVHDTPGIRTVMRWLALAVYRLGGWKTHGVKPPLNKYVIIAAPHTSNWDLPYMLCSALKLNAKLYWMGKDAIFRWPLKRFFKWLGGIPIDRSQSNNIVALSIEQFRQNKKLILTVPPSGTRKRVLNWKTGFYHIAHGAGVPIALGFLDYKKKIGGIGPLVRPTGNIEADMQVIKNFYNDISGKYPLQSIGTAVAKAGTAV